MFEACFKDDHESPVYHPDKRPSVFEISVLV